MGYTIWPDGPTGEASAGAARNAAEDLGDGARIVKLVRKVTP